MRRAAALIVGGGPAGAAAAIALARRGVRPLLVERHAEPHDALCGGFVSWRTLDRLDRLGLDRPALGGHAIRRVALFAGGRAAAAELPAPGLGLSRRRLDALLLGRAAAEGAGVERGVAVRAAEGGSVRLADGGEIAADALFLATGKHELRGLVRPGGGGDPWMGLRFRFAGSRALASRLEGTIELHLFRGGYAGLLLQEDGTANLCVALRRSRLAGAGGDPAALIEALRGETGSLGERLDGAAPLASDAVGRVPYGWRARDTRHGLFRLGDQAAVIPSLAGEGIGIALASGESAATAFLARGPAAASGWQRGFARSTRRPLAVAGLLKRASERPATARAGLALARVPGLVALLSRATRIAPPRA